MALLLDVIPGIVIGAFASGNILQVLLFAVLFGFALHRLGSKGQLIFNVIESLSQRYLRHYQYRSMAWRQSAPSEPWPLPLVNMASAPWCSWGS